MSGKISPEVYPELDEGVEMTLESSLLGVIPNEVRDLSFVITLKRK